VSKVARITDHLHIPVRPGYVFQDGEGVVGRAIVDEDVLVIVLPQSYEERPDAIIQLHHVQLFVITRRYNTDALHELDPAIGLKANTSLTVLDHK
jgi:hypothetical protein